jgi:hypothetical protein
MNDKEKIKEIEEKMKKIIQDSIVTEIKPKQFRNKITGEVKTQINIFELGDYEEI